jgi:S-formylglutathione hydrolase FrmB
VSTTRRRSGAVVVLGLLAFFVGAASAAPAGSASASAGPDAAIRTLSIRSLEPRLQEVALATAAVPGGRTRVRVLLPRGYDPKSARRYPVLYLLHGALGDHRSYTDERGFGLRGYTAKLPLIVVMPASGKGGGYLNWWNGGRGGPPQWETYHVRQLIPWIDSHYRTLGTRAGRAVAGLSMGGDGAFKYAAKHPDLFVAAHAFSGAVDVVWLAPALGSGPHLGPFATQEVRWRGNNPADLAENLRGLDLALRTGDGSPGGCCGESPWPNGLDPIEAGVHGANVSLHERLRSLRIAHVWDDYGPGGHTVGYWNRDLRLSLPALMRTFRDPPPPPRLVHLRAIEPRYSVYGWDVRIQRRALEFSELSRASRAGFRLSGSGSATVTTPAVYQPGASYRVTKTGTRPSTIQADRRGRLRIALRLGPANRFQQYTPEENKSPSRFHRVTVTVRPAR